MKYAEIRIGGADTSAPLNLAKRIRLIARYCDLSKVRFLDCGCGAGEYVFALRDEYGTDAWGIEYSKAKVAAAQANKRHGAHIRQGDLHDLDEPNSSVDVALLNEVLEHVPDDYRALQQVHRVLKPGGRVIVFSPNRFYPFETHGVRLRAIDTQIPSYVPLIPYVPLALGSLAFRYVARNYWPHELRSLVRRAGFTIQVLDFVWQTFEGLSGEQPALIRMAQPAFREIATRCERSPLIRRFGISQVIVGYKV